MMNTTVAKSKINIFNCVKRFLYRQGYEIQNDDVENNTIAALDTDDTIVIAHVITDERCNWSRKEFENALSHYTDDEGLPTRCSVRFDEIFVDVKEPDRAVIKHHKDVGSAARISDLINIDSVKDMSTKELQGLTDLIAHELVVRGED